MRSASHEQAGAPLVRADQLSMQPRLHSSRLRVNPSESSSSLTAGMTTGANAVAVMEIACPCA